MANNESIIDSKFYSGINNSAALRGLKNQLQDA